MKKLLLLLTVLFISCQSRKAEFVVVQINQTPCDVNHLFCDYTLSRSTFKDALTYVTDTCGKYTVGDTLRFTK